MTVLLMFLFVFQCVYDFKLINNKHYAYGIFTLPFLMSCVNLTFILPQILSIYYERGDLDGFMDLPLLVFVSCNMAASIGFRIMARKSDRSYFSDNFTNTTLYTIILFTVVGAISYFINRGVYRGGFVDGKYVIVNFFIGYLQYALVLLLITHKQFPFRRYIFVALVCFISILYFDKVILTGRRNDAVRIFVILLFFFFYYHNYSCYIRFRWLLPAFFVAGMLFNTQIEDYRIQAYGDVSFIDNIMNLDFAGATQSLLENSESEVFNGMRGINYCKSISGYNWGAYDWNRVIHDFVPKAIVGQDFKDAITFRLPTDSIEDEMTEFGNTFTGYYDAYASFGMFGFIKFLVMGMLMGYLWRRLFNSNICMMLYLCVITNCLHVPTHTTSYFTNGLIFFVVFVYPFVKRFRIKRCRVNIQ